LHDVRPISLVHAHAWMTWHYFIGLSEIKTGDSAQPRNHSIVQTLFLVRGRSLGMRLERDLYTWLSLRGL